MIVKLLDLSKNLTHTQKFYLLYGTNTGQIDETINNILKPKLSKNIYNYDESEIIANANEFEEDILNSSFFDDDKLIIINRGSDKILSVIESLISKKISETTIIIKANILEKKSKLRNFFEKNKETICTPFYDDNYQSLLLIAQNFFSKNKIKISIQNINLILERSKKNRIYLKNELEKIKIFYQKKSSIEYEDIVKLTNSAENYNISELTDKCLMRNKKKTINILNENISTPEDNILILRSLLFKLKRLKKLKEEIKKQKNQEQVISSFRPTIFWKDKDIIKQQLKVLTIEDIKVFLKKINNLEIIIKQNSNLSNEITNNFILETINYSNNSI
ncbi:DNA polymerase III subunit delta [Pelagibacterales bacterium SAG-MED43]|nr:DNA polymerase III subunit delta [Pelagibacterales bacterium SAG-MED43]